MRAEYVNEFRHFLNRVCDPTRFSDDQLSAALERTLAPHRIVQYARDENGKAWPPPDRLPAPDFHDLAQHYADQWNALEEVGLDVTREETDAVDDELDGTGVVLNRSDKWAVLPTQYAAGQVWGGGVAVRGRYRVGDGWAPIKYAKRWARSEADVPKNRKILGRTKSGGVYYDSALTTDDKPVEKSDVQKKRTTDLGEKSKTVDVKQLKGKLAKYDGVQLDEKDQKSLARSMAALKSHHGANAGARIAELVDANEAKLAKVKDPKAKEVMAKTMRGLSLMLDKLSGTPAGDVGGAAPTSTVGGQKPAKLVGDRGELAKKPIYPGNWGTKEQPYYRPGPNPTVDNVITRDNPQTGQKEVLLIKRGANASAEANKWAMPGGFHDSDWSDESLSKAGITREQLADLQKQLPEHKPYPEGHYPPKGQAWAPGKESANQAALRELAEETGLDASQLAQHMKSVGTFQGGGRDPRDNEKAWSQSEAFALHLPPELAQKSVAGLDDAQDAKWVPVNDLGKMDMAFDHGKILEKAGVGAQALKGGSDMAQSAPVGGAVKRQLSEAKTMKEKLTAAGSVDTEVLDKSYRQAGLSNNEAMRTLQARYESLQRSGLDPKKYPGDAKRINESMDSTKGVIQEAITGLRNIGKAAEADWYEQHGLPMLEEARRDLLGDKADPSVGEGAVGPPAGAPAAPGSPEYGRFRRDLLGDKADPSVGEGAVGPPAGAPAAPGSPEYGRFRLLAGMKDMGAKSLEDLTPDEKKTLMDRAGVKPLSEMASPPGEEEGIDVEPPTSEEMKEPNRTSGQIAVPEGKSILGGMSQDVAGHAASLASAYRMTDLQNKDFKAGLSGAVGAVQKGRMSPKQAAEQAAQAAGITSKRSRKALGIEVEEILNAVKSQAGAEVHETAAGDVASHVRGMASGSLAKYAGSQNYDEIDAYRNKLMTFVKNNPPGAFETVGDAAEAMKKGAKPMTPAQETGATAAKLGRKGAAASKHRAFEGYKTDPKTGHAVTEVKSWDSIMPGDKISSPGGFDAVRSIKKLPNGDMEVTFENQGVVKAAQGNWPEALIPEGGQTSPDASIASKQERRRAANEKVQAAAAAEKAKAPEPGPISDYTSGSSEDTGEYSPDLSTVKTRAPKRAQQVINHLAKGGGGRYNFVKTAAETGYATDGRMAFKIKDQDRPVYNTAGAGQEGRTIGKHIIDGLLKTPHQAETAKIVGGRMAQNDVKGRKALLPRYMLQSSKGAVSVDANILDTVRTQYPNATMHLAQKRPNESPIIFKVGDEVVGVMMPLSVVPRLKKVAQQPPNQPTEQKQKPREQMVFGGVPVEGEYVKNGEKKHFRKLAEPIRYATAM